MADPNQNSREDNIYFARLSEQGERYEDMINYMKAVARVSRWVHWSNMYYVLDWQRAFKRRKKSVECRLQEFGEDKTWRMENYSSHLQQGRSQGKSTL